MKTIVRFMDGRTSERGHLYPEIAYLYGDLFCQYSDVICVEYEPIAGG